MIIKSESCFPPRGFITVRSLLSFYSSGSQELHTLSFFSIFQFPLESRIIMNSFGGRDAGESMLNMLEAAKGFVQMQMQTLHSPRFRILPEKLVVLHLLSASVHSWPTRPLPCPFPCHFTMSKHHVCVRSLHGEQGAAATLMNIGEWLDCGPVGYAISGLCKTLVLCCSFMFLHVAALLII